MSIHDYNPSQDYLDMERTAKQLRREINAATEIIRDGILRYKKKKLRARLKKQVEDDSVFEDLKPYNSSREIQDAYGWDIISESEMDRLNLLWEEREQHMLESGKYQDGVIKLLEHAMAACFEPHSEYLDEFDNTKRQAEADIRRIERENAANLGNGRLKK